MKGELVRVWTEDELQLQGLHCTAQEKTGLPAVLHIHGATSNFYRSQFLDRLADELNDRGYGFLSGNTRGHDIMNKVYAKDPTASRRLGVAFEIFEDCILDLRAWLDLLQEQGYEGAVLLGHSFGALKVAHYQSEAADDRVKALIFLSPPAQGFRKEAPGTGIEKILAWAEDMVSRGMGDSLFSGPPMPYPMSAATIHSLSVSKNPDIFKFGRPHERWETIERLHCPILVVMGTLAEHITPSPAEALAILTSKAVSSQRCDTVVLEGAPHNYRGHEALAAQLIAGWVDDVFAGQRLL
ncbi:MAG: alpha/beta fold hydrolase [Anaerolineae bacterium]|nr:alpha/beta fold hydrolase [Anaerolineae bacterium]NIN97551.1 alpha/beta fold hydrolase [Anaerolineae bacterium]NIQ80479.1 alpha/beta fold hydrolase [Anaerolineae bacterium]